MDIKKYGVVYLLIAFVAAIFVGTRLFPDLKLIGSTPNTVETSPVDKVAVTVAVDFGDKKKTYENIAAPNAYLALMEAVKADNLEVGTKQFDFGILVESIGSYTNTKDRVWIYYVNGTSGDVAADKKVLLVGDKVEWKYVKPQ